MDSHLFFFFSQTVWKNGKKVSVIDKRLCRWVQAESHLCHPSNRAKAMEEGEVAAKKLELLRRCFKEEARLKLDFSPKQLKIPHSHPLHREVRMLMVEMAIGGKDLRVLQARAAIRNIIAHNLAVENLAGKSKMHYEQICKLLSMLKTK